MASMAHKKKTVPLSWCALAFAAQCWCIGVLVCWYAGVWCALELTVKHWCAVCLVGRRAGTSLVCRLCQWVDPGAVIMSFVALMVVSWLWPSKEWPAFVMLFESWFDVFDFRYVDS